MTTTVGLPFILVSATAPLIQSWFSRSRIPGAEDPYFLYAASNAGSMLGLLSYPLVIEPLFRLREQALAWTGGFVVLGVMIAACGFALLRTISGAPAPSGASLPRTAGIAAERSGLRRRLRWILLAAAPSSLLLGATTHITTDVASVPMLWIAPLSLYLLSFVIAFSKQPFLRHGWVLRAAPYVALIFAFVTGISIASLLFTLALHLVLLFTFALMCHGELARDRPSAQHLTEFYLLISFGGMLGGVFNAIVAPLVFNGVYEYPLAVVLACLLLPGLEKGALRNTILVTLAVMAGAVAAHYLQTISLIAVLAVRGALVLWIFSWKDRPLRLGLAVGVLLAAPFLWQVFANPNLEQKRNFFGVHTVSHDRTGQFLKLAHGTTLHGAQHVDPARRREPLTYYGTGGPAGQALAAFGPASRRIGIVGLGSGSLACYRQPGQEWTFYEIDPDVVETARSGRHFTFLKDCAPDAAMVIGDARLSLAAEPAGRFDLLVLDAFSSDSIPVHLLTREAFALYGDKLAANGVLLVHVSNRHMALAPLVAKVGAEHGMTALLQMHRPSQDEIDRLHAPSQWVLLSRSPSALSVLMDDSRWQQLTPDATIRAWTDDYSNLLSVLRR